MARFIEQSMETLLKAIPENHGPEFKEQYVSWLRQSFGSYGKLQGLIEER